MQEDSREGSISIFILAAAITGAVSGIVVGLILQSVVTDGRILSVITALVAVAVVGVARQLLNEAYPMLFAPGTRNAGPLALWAAIIFAALAGGLAGHDVASYVGMVSGPLVGLFAGTFATIGMAVCSVLYYHDALAED